MWPCWDIVHDVPLELWHCFWLPGALDAWDAALAWIIA